MNDPYARVPARLANRPVDPERGFLVPWFVANINGRWDFRVIRPGGVKEAMRRECCWLCGERLGRFRAFVVGPMCIINRISAEPPSHLECARYAVRACPFLTNPAMRRSPRAQPEEARKPPGEMIERNPGVTAIFISDARNYSTWPNGLFRLGEPEFVFWFCRGRMATQQEVDDSIASGLPILREACERDENPDTARAALAVMIEKSQPWLRL